MADKIVTNQSFLRNVSLPTTRQEVEAFRLVDRLRAANETAWTSGCGLAAIQIGIPIRFAWFKWGDREFTLLNPKIVEYAGKVKFKSEGCLSIPNKTVKVKRAYKIRYISDGKEFKAKGFKAHIIQHEVDHMNGILNIDKE